MKFSLHPFQVRLLISIGLATLVALLAVNLAEPIQYAIEIGGDEHFELTKGWLWSEGFPLYSRVWSDQPPLFTVILGLLFKSTGPSIVAARMLAIMFGLSLFTVFFLLVKRSCGMVAAFVGVICLVVSPHTLAGCVSAMQEVPTLGTALWSLWFVQIWEETKRTKYLVLSGLLMAVAIQIKVTAFIVLLPLSLQFLVNAQCVNLTQCARSRFRPALIWLASASIVFLIICWRCGGSYQQMWALHFSPQVTNSTGAEHFIFSGKVLFDHIEGMFGMGAALLALSLRRNWRIILFSSSLFLTAFVLFIEHRPWWSYYYPYIAVPVAWLTGYGITQLFSFAWSDEFANLFRFVVRRVGCLATASLLCATVIVEGGNRLISTVRWMRSIPPADGSLLAVLSKYGSHTSFVYTKSVIYPFRAGLTVIPELGVISSKRIWSGQLDDQKKLAIVKQYKPEEIFLTKDDSPLLWRDLLQEQYTLVFESADYRLFVLNRVTNNASKGISEEQNARL